MAAIPTRALKSWYRDSSGLPKKVIAKSRYLLGRTHVRLVRLAWTVATSPIQMVAWVMLQLNPKQATALFQKLVLRNPWISGALPGLIKSALRSGEITIAVSAALKYDRLHQRNHGIVAAIWQEFLIGEPGWGLPRTVLTGAEAITLDRTRFEQELKNLSRTPHYTESALVVVSEQLGQKAANIELAVTSEQDVYLVLIALALLPQPLKVSVNTVSIQPRTEIEKRRLAKFLELENVGVIEVQR
ncbi:MAG: hypothetical protein RL038_155 [Actinomycetota bacterium]